MRCSGRIRLAIFVCSGLFVLTKDGGKVICGDFLDLGQSDIVPRYGLGFLRFRNGYVKLYEDRLC
jgi:hypothetical protein